MTEEELRDLQERVALVKELTSHPGWELLLDASRHALLKVQVRVIQGKCETYEEYVKECSFGDGVEYMMGLPARLESQLATALEGFYPEEEEEED